MRFSEEELKKIKDTAASFEEYLKALEQVAKEKQDTSRCMACFFYVCRCKSGLRDKK